MDENANRMDLKETDEFKEYGFQVVNCPVCGGKILMKRGKRKTVFYSCENYNTCKFSSWDLPLNETCPECGQMLFRKKGKNRIVCHNEACGYKRDTEPEAETENTND